MACRPARGAGKNNHDDGFVISVTVCRGCCCGTERKHPETDHAGQLRQLAEAGVRVRVADCLDVCQHSNVMVVHPGFALRRQGARVVWLGGVLEPRLVVHIGRWAAQGGPGAAAIPEAVRPFVIARPAKSRAATPTVLSGLGWPDVVGQALVPLGVAEQGQGAGDTTAVSGGLCRSDVVGQALVPLGVAEQGQGAGGTTTEATA